MSFFDEYSGKICVGCYNIVKKSCPLHLGNVQLGFNSLEKTTQEHFLDRLWEAGLFVFKVFIHYIYCFGYNTHTVLLITFVDL